MVQDTNITARREVIRSLVTGSLGLWFSWKPALAQEEELIAGEAYEDITIRAFIETIVPDTDTTHPNLTVVFHDPSFGFEKVRGLFTSDLRNRAWAKYGTPAFHNLAYDKKAAIIREGLDERGRISQLYSGAVFAAQLTVFTGFYKKEACCPLINSREGPCMNEVAYPDRQKPLPNAMATGGNNA